VPEEVVPAKYTRTNSKMSDNDEIVNPNEHLIIPDWINEKYFEGVLAKDEPDHVKVLKFTVVAAIPPGENFTSTMLRVYIKLEMKGEFVVNICQ